jgi:hypothetical protein
LFAATILTLLLIFGGLGAIVFGVGGALAFGSYALMPIALAGLISFAGGIAFAFKVARPAWRMTIGKE